MNLVVLEQEMRCADEMVIDQMNERNANVCGAQNARYLLDRPQWYKSF